jgi:hypothetical protein
VLVSRDSPGVEVPAAGEASAGEDAAGGVGALVRVAGTAGGVAREAVDDVDGAEARAAAAPAGTAGVGLNELPAVPDPDADGATCAAAGETRVAGAVANAVRVSAGRPHHARAAVVATTPATITATTRRDAGRRISASVSAAGAGTVVPSGGKVTSSWGCTAGIEGGAAAGGIAGPRTGAVLNAGCAGIDGVAAGVGAA